MVCEWLCRLANRTSRNLPLTWPFSCPISLVNTSTVIFYFLLSYYTSSGAASPASCTPAPSPHLSSLLPSFGDDTNRGSERVASGSWEGNWEAALFLWLSIWFATSMPLTYSSCQQSLFIFIKIPRFTYIDLWSFTSLSSSITCMNLC